MIITGFCNLKGGVGKTTACQNMAAALAKMGKRIAVVDMDPQSNLSAGFGLNLSPEDPQVFDLLTSHASWDDIVQTREDVDVIPSSLSLVMAELNQEGPLNSDFALRDALGKLNPDRYDYIFLDSPPQLGMFTRNVLAACKNIIVPMDGGFYSLVGLRLLSSALPVLRERLNPELKISGILMTNYNPRLSISRDVHNDVKKNFSDVLFESWIRPNVSLVEASSIGVSILKHSPKSKGAECYKEVAAEFLKRMNDKPCVTSQPVQTARPEHVPEDTIELPDDDVNIASDSEMLQKVHEPVHVEAPQPVHEEPVLEPEHEHVPEPVEVPKPVHEEQVPQPEPEPKPIPVPALKSDGKTITDTRPYERKIKQDVIDMLPEKEKASWVSMLDPVVDITREQIDVHELRDNFEESDKDRFTFYVLNDEYNTLWPVMYPDQIIDPLRCVIKWDENGAAEVFM